jgi:hypothetical protein
MTPDEIPGDVSDDLRERWGKVNGVSASLMRAFLAAIDMRHATRGDWLQDEFGLDAREVEALRDRCLNRV